MYKTLVSAQELKQHIKDPSWLIFDCRFSLADKEKGRSDYKTSHIEGAQYLHLDEDLSGQIIPGQTGRHPLPDPTSFAERLAQCGVTSSSQVVAYDDAGGAIASRLWWMMQWVGHDAAAVLDGGWQAWTREELPVKSGVETRPGATFTPQVRQEMVAEIREVDRKRNDPNFLLLDARGADRYRGENETIDPVAGHIPGAISEPYAENLRSNGTFHSISYLANRFRAPHEEANPERTIVYCGSGVTACHNILAMAHAGLGRARLYPGSWSEWIIDPSRPTATGNSVYGEGS